MRNYRGTVNSEIDQKLAAIKKILLLQKILGCQKI